MLSRFFIYRPIFAGVLSIVILLAGGITIPLLPVEQTPDITPPTVSVKATYPGASATVIRDTLAVPIENEVNGVEDMIYMSSTSSDDGTYELTVTFKVGTDIDMATVLVDNRVKIALPKLPEEVQKEGVTTKKRSTNMVLMVNLISPEGEYDEIYLSNYITVNIKDQLSRVEGVGEVTVMGAKDYSMRIWLDPDRLKARRLTTNDVVNALREQNVQVAAGQIGAPPNPAGQAFQYTVNTLGRLSEVEQFEDIVIKVGENRRALRIRDVARVELGAQSYNWNVQLDGKPSIAIGIYQLPGANALKVAQGIYDTMEELKTSFPEDVEYDIAYDTTMFVTASIKEVVITLGFAMILVILTVWVFLQDFRTTLIPAATIPVSLIGTFGVMMALGMSINTLSLFGLVLAIGIVVDDAIVVVENTMRIMDEDGLPAKEATEKAMNEITGPVIATTLVLLAVFVPTAMMGGITGRMYQQFAITIAAATVFSSINALTLSPALCGLLLRPKPEKRGWFASGFNKIFDFTTAGYMRGVGLLTRRLSIAFVLFLSLLALSVVGFLQVPGGFIPNEDQGYFLISAQLPEGATLERTQEVLDEVNTILADAKGVANIIAVSGYSALDSLVTPNAGTFFVVLKPWDQRKSQEEKVASILQEVQPKLRRIKAAITFAFLPPPITGLGNAGGFDFRLQDRGNAGAAELSKVARQLVLEAAADPNLERMNNNFQANAPQLFLDVNREKVKGLKIPLKDVYSTLQANLGSAYVNDFNKFGKVWKVIIQADQKFRSRVDHISQLQVRNQSGGMIPLRTLLSVKDTAGPKTIYRYNMYSAATITGQGSPGVSSNQANAAMEEAAAQTLPATMDYEWSGVTFQQQAVGNQAPIIFGLALFVVFLVLAAQYESWSIPFAVLLSVPFALFGAIMFTWVRALDNNIYTQIGLVLLIGLSCKSAILIVEFAKQRREAGKTVMEAALDAARLRFRAILMTAFSFILGVIPLVFATGAGAASRRALGTAVFGGMLAATIFGVFLIPVLYLVVQRTSERLSGKRDDDDPKNGSRQPDGSSSDY